MDPGLSATEARYQARHLFRRGPAGLRARRWQGIDVDGHPAGGGFDPAGMAVTPAPGSAEHVLVAGIHQDHFAAVRGLPCVRLAQGHIGFRAVRIAQADASHHLVQIIPAGGKAVVKADHVENTLAGGLTPHGSHAFNAYTPLLSRGDRALKIWMTIQSLGTRRLAEVFEKNADQAEYLASLAQAHPDLELMAPVGLNIVCFRYRGRADEASLDRLNERILVNMQESGFCVVSPYRIRGRFALRVAISNHRTTRADLEALARRVGEEGARLQAAEAEEPAPSQLASPMP